MTSARKSDEKTAQENVTAAALEATAKNSRRKKPAAASGSARGRRTVKRKDGESTLTEQSETSAAAGAEAAPQPAGKACLSVRSSYSGADAAGSDASTDPGAAAQADNAAASEAASEEKALKTRDENAADGSGENDERVKDPAFVMPLKEQLPLQVLMGRDSSRRNEEAAREAHRARLAREARLLTQPGAMRQVYALDRRGNVTVSWVERTPAADDGRIDASLCLELMAALSQLKRNDDPELLWETFARRACLAVPDMKERFARFCSTTVRKAAGQNDAQGKNEDGAVKEAGVDAARSAVALERAARTGTPLAQVIARKLDAARRDPGVAAEVAERYVSLRPAWAAGRAAAETTVDEKGGEGAGVPDEKTPSQQASGRGSVQAPVRAPIPATAGTANFPKAGSWMRAWCRDAKDALQCLADIAASLLQLIAPPVLRLCAAFSARACRKAQASISQLCRRWTAWACAHRLRAGLVAAAGAALLFTVLQGPAGAWNTVLRSADAILLGRGAPSLLTVDLAGVRGVLLDVVQGASDARDGNADSMSGNALALAMVINERYDEFLARALREEAFERRAVLLDAASVLVAHEDAVDDVTGRVRERILAQAQRVLENGTGSGAGSKADAARLARDFAERHASGLGRFTHEVLPAAAQWVAQGADSALAWVGERFLALWHWFWPGKEQMHWPDSLRRGLEKLNAEVEDFMAERGDVKDRGEGTLKARGNADEKKGSAP